MEGRFMFKRTKIADERIVNTKNKIYRECYNLVMFISLGSIIVKMILGMRAMENFALELILLIGVSSYYTIRAVKLGVFSEEAELLEANRKVKIGVRTAIAGVAFGIVLGVIFGINSAMNYANSTSQGVYYFFLTFFISVMMYATVFFVIVLIPYLIAKKKSEQVNSKMLDE